MRVVLELGRRIKAHAALHFSKQQSFKQGAAAKRLKDSSAVYRPACAAGHPG